MQITETGHIESTMVLEPAKYDGYTLCDYWDSYTAKMLLTGLAPRPTRTEPQDWGWFDGVKFISGIGQEISCEDDSLPPSLKRYGQISDLVDVNASPQQDWFVPLKDGPIPPPFIKPQYFVRPREFVKWAVLHEFAVPEPILPLMTPVLDRDITVHRVAFEIVTEDASLNDFFPFSFYRYFPLGVEAPKPRNRTRKLNAGAIATQAKAIENEKLLRKAVDWVIQNRPDDCRVSSKHAWEAKYVLDAIGKSVRRQTAFKTGLLPDELPPPFPPHSKRKFPNVREYLDELARTIRSTSKRLI